MESTNAIEVFGTIRKQETLLTIDDKVQTGTLVFEALEPFPGYYHETPFGTNPVYMYLALQQQYPLIDMIRATQKVEKDFNEKFDAGKGFVNFVDTSYNVLRIRHLNRYDLIGDLQNAYNSHGIHFMMKTKRGFEGVAQIKVVKFFNLTPLAEGIYLDNKEENHAYIELPKELNWDDFNALSNRVKYNWEESKFDAAVGAFMHKGQLHEFVRIYSNKLTLDYLEALRQLYLEKMK
ncbi:hypothetical protein [Mangrovibacterium marinum]|uniref:Uncharacterized protein n=1 Tax=Mangrovibacterium marinum TaxID=1639118 RepID=A0A2T5C6M4_9BACT|nr:hypothetical protein [Mangrovibacterium marinum]PTN10598.1 hypothetical protein C8N47_101248 [Mangrovibacterium marinum]